MFPKPHWYEHERKWGHYGEIIICKIFQGIWEIATHMKFEHETTLQIFLVEDIPLCY